MGQLLPAQSIWYLCARRLALMILDSRIEEENDVSQCRELTK